MQQSVKLRGHVHKLSPLSAVKYSDHALDSHSIPASLSGMSEIQGVLHIHTHKLGYKVKHSAAATHT